MILKKYDLLHFMYCLSVKGIITALQLLELLNLGNKS